MTSKPKLIEVALPLAAINAESAREKSIRHGHPSTLHLWWARRPLATARAVIWASLVDDPSGDPSLSPEEQDAERQRLFRILEKLVVWENSNNPQVLAEAKAEIDRCYPDGPPPILDPFGGGGAIPLEAQRLGLTAITGDLNPVAVLIQKAMLEIPPRFANRPPVHPSLQNELGQWTGAQGLAADVEAYGKWMRDEAQRRIGHHYPDAVGPNGEKLTPIAWIWARTVKSPDPTWNGHVPLVASWILSKKPGKPTVWIEPIIDRDTQTIHYEIRHGGQPTHERTVNRGNGTCIATGAAIPLEYVDGSANQGRMGAQLVALVADGPDGRVYLSPTHADSLAAIGLDREEVVREANLGSVKTRGTFGGNAQGRYYGFNAFEDYFTCRQLLALTTFSDLLSEIRAICREDSISAGMSKDGARLHEAGEGADSYSDAVVTYLALVVDKCADYWSSLCSWHNSGEKIRNTFGRQAISMTWDFAETNPFSSSSGNWMAMVNWTSKALANLPASGNAEIVQQDARVRTANSPGAAISTDPPYYDNISYADLSDFFYVWLRRNLISIWPNEFTTLATPKGEELIANRYRAGSRAEAEKHFESGMAEFMSEVAESQHTHCPSTIYYAYKATESRDGETRSTGWDTFLQAIIDAGLTVTATWPMRTELDNRMVASGTNALASSIVLTCRKRQLLAQIATRAEFVASLRQDLPEAVRILQTGNIAPVDLPQSTMGPGISIFSRFSKIVESDGSVMRVSTALGLINEVLGEILDGEESEMDAESRFALTWYSQFGYNPASSGDADNVARAKNTSTAGVVASGLGEARAGKFRLFERADLDPDWTPVGDDRLTVWESTQYLIAALERSESEAASLLRQLGGFAERARTLAYLLFKKATDKGWAAEAGAYNGLIAAWPTLQSIQVEASSGSAQQQMDLG